MNHRKLVLGTRESKLAVRQAEMVKEQLELNGIEVEIKGITSDGDKDRVRPLYEIGVQGIFTKTLDAALLSGEIDIAVHSMKDMPVQLAQGIQQAAVLKRASPYDVLVYAEKYDAANVQRIGSSSIRRKAQWLNKFPQHEILPIRGNVDTRLLKLEEGDFDAVIFAEAGLDRINLKPENCLLLDWMLPAPAQGAILVVCREGEEAKNICRRINDEETANCVYAERLFLKRLGGGCSEPVAALAEIQDDKIHFKGGVYSVDGKRKMEIQLTDTRENYSSIGLRAADELLAQGVKELLE